MSKSHLYSGKGDNAIKAANGMPYKPARLNAVRTGVRPACRQAGATVMLWKYKAGNKKNYYPLKEQHNLPTSVYIFSYRAWQRETINHLPSFHENNYRNYFITALY